MSKMKTVRDGAVIALALATAYGMGIISCVWWELKALASVSKEPEERRKVTYHSYRDRES